MSIPVIYAPCRTHLHLQTPCRHPAPFSVGLLRDHSSTPKSSRHRCAADSNGGKQQNVSQQMGDEVMQRLREAEKEAADLREQLAKAKAEAEVWYLPHTAALHPPNFAGSSVWLAIMHMFAKHSVPFSVLHMLCNTLVLG